jgi:quinol monooxygenase YgiN
VADTASKLAVMIRIKVQPGRRDQWRSLWDEHLRARAEANPAQELYLVVYDTADADVVHLIELYSDPAQMRRNADAKWFADYLGKAGLLLAEPPAMVTGRPVWAKGARV